MSEITKLSWIINNACNLKCVHCYPNSGAETRKEFATEDFETLCNNLMGMHFKRVFLSGGEPILDKNFYKYLEIALKISDDVFICSNGTRLTDEVLQSLQSAGVKGIVLSLQALDDETSKAIYGFPDVPDLVFQAIKKIQKYNFSLGVETTILKQNVQFIDDIIEKLISLNVQFISFKRLLLVGRATIQNISISKEEHYEVLQQIFRWQMNHPKIRFNVHDPLYATIIYDHFEEFLADNQNQDFLNWIKGFSCRAGTKWLGIDPDGNVSPCPLLLYKDTIVGNVFKTPLSSIISETKLFELLNRAEQIESNCCKYGSMCLGCRVSAIGKYNDLFAKDPVCIHTHEKCPITMFKEV